MSRGKTRACRYCGCTDDRACEGGCSWVEWDVCSACEALNRYLDVLDDRGGPPLCDHPLIIQAVGYGLAHEIDPEWRWIADRGTDFGAVFGRPPIRGPRPR